MDFYISKLLSNLFSDFIALIEIEIEHWLCKYFTWDSDKESLIEEAAETVVFPSTRKGPVEKTYFVHYCIWPNDAGLNVRAWGKGKLHCSCKGSILKPRYYMGRSC